MYPLHKKHRQSFQDSGEGKTVGSDTRDVLSTQQRKQNGQLRN
jgi:hypothetical protein